MVWPLRCRSVVLWPGLLTGPHRRPKVSSEPPNVLWLLDLETTGHIEWQGRETPPEPEWQGRETLPQPCLAELAVAIGCPDLQ